MTTIKDLVAEGRSLLEKCSEGPWMYVKQADGDYWLRGPEFRGSIDGGVFIKPEDAKIITLSRNHLSQLLDAVERYEAALKYIANSIPGPEQLFEMENKNAAREALSQIQKEVE